MHQASNHPLWQTCYGTGISLQPGLTLRIADARPSFMIGLMLACVWRHVAEGGKMDAPMLRIPERTLSVSESFVETQSRLRDTLARRIKDLRLPISAGVRAN